MYTYNEILSVQVHWFLAEIATASERRVLSFQAELYAFVESHVYLMALSRLPQHFRAKYSL